MKKLLTIAACLIMMALLHAQTPIFVTPTGNGTGITWADACNLETAVVLASLNDRMQIWVQKGTYYPSKMLIIPDSVKIYGGFAGTEDDLSQRNFVANPAIIDGQQKIGSIFRLGKSAKINGFTIQHGNANGTPHKNGGGVWADDNAVIENCSIVYNAAIADGGGIYAKGNLNLISSIVENNTASDGANLYGNCITELSIPVIISHPDATPKSVVRGGNFPALTVSATSALSLSYQWFSNATANNENGISLGNSNGAQTTAYTPQDSTVSASYYYCEITNSDGTTKSNVSGLHTVTTPVIVATGCNSNTPGWGTSLGSVTWDSYSDIENSARTIGTQVWSGTIRTSVCTARSTGYAGGSSGNFNADCRNNPGYGDLFSWCAVVRFADDLCPYPWRVPTMDDFVNLDKALGGTGANGQNNTTQRDKYINSWGGAYGGSCTASGSFHTQGRYAYYYSQMEYLADNGYHLVVGSNGYIYPQSNYYYGKDFGFMLRCVK